MKNDRQIRRSLLIGGALCLVFALFLAGVMLWEHNKPGLPLPTAPQTTSAAIETESVLPTTEATVPTTLPQYEARRINFLLVGRDAHGEGENGRSDSMILCSVDTGSKSVTLISFLRDIYLRIPGHGSSRLNASYSWGGAELLKQTLEENFGVTADVTLEIDFEGFQNVIDHLGGVDIDLTDKEADHLNNGHGWTLHAGVNHLDGQQALAYSRIRYLDSDFYRTERQRNVLTALLTTYGSAGYLEMLNATDAFLDQSTSDHTDEELLEYALELYAMLDDFEIDTHRIPADGTYSYETIRGMSVIEVDFEENRELLSSILG